MSNFDFLRSGNDLVQDTNNPAVDKDFLRMVMSVMTILCEEAMHTAVKYAKCCGRNSVTSKDTMYALKYESHAFWDKDIDERFVERLQEERTHTYETTDDEDSNDDDNDEDESEEEEFTSEFVSGDRLFYDRVMKICDDWDRWQPDDPVKRLLKHSIEKTESRFQ